MQKHNGNGGKQFQMPGFCRKIASYVRTRILHIPQRIECEDYDKKLLNENSAFGVVEAYRMLRTNLLYTGALADHAIIGLTSAMPNEGKTLTCMNLAISFAMAGKKTLIIDGDMRNPSQVKGFGTPIHLGLSEYLSGIRKDPVIQKTGRDNLFLMVAGKRPPNTAELLASPRMKELLESLREEYDVIFLDLPPIGLVSDTMVVAEMVDGMMLVVQAGESDARNVQAAIATLEQMKAHILGVVLNNVSQKSGGYGRYGRYGKYGKCGSYGAYGAPAEANEK